MDTIMLQVILISGAVGIICAGARFGIAIAEWQERKITTKKESK